ncbi:LysR family transcriptional regulator [Agromyces intestinalis]|uniref:LysR family transcriptional regulator n=1 Tax=Agromyces intestinalis TaxID=2592652 RepID=A0A5C1YI77_9MICO|nr:LysR family transcriptional regulator [Agromyces intestinalis]QEO15681.1 LysR family transcriptional regulator [Agromyces intestinalis]
MTDAATDELVADLVAAIDVQTVRVVRAVAEHCSLTAAAVALGYSQPAVSQQLRRFEDRTGVALVERVGRGIRLTEAGRVLARHAHAVATALEAAAGELAALRGLRAGRVRLVAFPSASATLVPRLIAELGRTHPGLTVTYVEAEPPEAVAAVRADRADLAVTFSYPGDRDDPHRESARGLDVHDFGREPVRLVLPAQHPAASDEVVDLATLAHEPWIAGCPRCRGHLLDLADDAGFLPRIVVETDNFVAVEGMVAQGLGVALLPGLALAASPRHPGVVTRPTARSDERSLHLVTARGGARVPAVAAAMRALETARSTLGAVDTMDSDV